MAFEIPADPTALTFEKYAALDIDSRVALVGAVYEKYNDKIEAIIGRAAWALVCGPECEVVNIAEKSEDILTDEEIWEKAAEIGFAPYHFFKAEVVEDLAAA
jgi:hypothetical protein